MMNTTRFYLSVCMLFICWSTCGVAQNLQIPHESNLLPEDPNFDPDFDWTLNEPYDLFVQTAEGIIRHPNIRLPYFDNSGPAANDFNSDLPGVRDILPEDGWVLLFKDFGTETRGVAFPRIILYNRFRGLLRLFYFNGHFPESFTYGVVSLTRQSASNPFALFTFSDEQRTTLEDFDPNRTEIFIGKLQPLVWNYADFIVAGYDPNLPDDAKFVFQITGVRSSNVELTGDISLDQVLENSNINLSRSNPLGSIIDIGSGMISSFRNSGAVIGGLNSLVDEKKGTFKDAFFANVLRDALQGSFFGNVVPAIAVAASFFKMFSGGSKPAQVQPMKFEGQLSLSGTIKLEGDIQSFLLRVPGARHLGDDNLPFYDKPLGIFNLRKKPVIGVRTLMEVQPCRNIEKREPVKPLPDPDFPRGHDIKVDVQVGPKILRMPFPKEHQHRLERPAVVVNPEAGIKTKVDVAFVRPNALPDFYGAGSSDGFFDISRARLLTDRLKGPAQCNDPAPKVKKRKIIVRITIEPEVEDPNFTPITLVKLYPAVYRDGGIAFAE